MRWLFRLVKGVLNVLATVIAWAVENPVTAGAVGAGCLVAGLFIQDGDVRDVVVSLGWFFLTTAATGWVIQLLAEGADVAARSYQVVTSDASWYDGILNWLFPPTSFFGAGP